LPPLVGYLVAGILFGPSSPGFVGNVDLAGQFAEVGVILLMFGVGLHFSVSDLLAVRWIAVPGAIGQIVLATAVGAAIALGWGWTLGAGLVLGLALSVASTVVLLRALDQRNGLEVANGRIAVGWLIVEDLAMVLTLVLLPLAAGALGGHAGPGAPAPAMLGMATSPALAVFLTLAKVAAFVALIMGVGRRAIPWMLGQVARTGSRELFTLAVLATALGIAYGSAELFGVSFALGAFFAGLVLSGSELSHRAAAESLPLQDAFAVLVLRLGRDALRSVGPRSRPARGDRRAARDLLGKSLAAFAIVLMLGYPIETGAHGVGEPGADRRVLVHSGRPRHEPRSAAGRGPRPRARRSAALDHLEPARFRIGRAPVALARTAGRRRCPHRRGGCHPAGCAASRRSTRRAPPPRPRPPRGSVCRSSA
jgi:CPA2 family monovalent cation:H+ antiporter-2